KPLALYQKRSESVEGHRQPRVPAEAGTKVLFRLFQPVQILVGQPASETKHQGIGEEAQRFREDLDSRGRLVVSKKNLPELQMRLFAARVERQRRFCLADGARRVVLTIVDL